MFVAVHNVQHVRCYSIVQRLDFGSRWKLWLWYFSAVPSLHAEVDLGNKN